MGLASTAGLSRIGRWRKGARACIISRCRAAYLFVGARGALDPPRCPGSNRGRSGMQCRPTRTLRLHFNRSCSACCLLVPTWLPSIVVYAQPGLHVLQATPGNRQHNNPNRNRFLVFGGLGRKGRASFALLVATLSICRPCGRFGAQRQKSLDLSGRLHNCVATAAVRSFWTKLPLQSKPPRKAGSPLCIKLFVPSRLSRPRPDCKFATRKVSSKVLRPSAVPSPSTLKSCIKHLLHILHLLPLVRYRCSIRIPALRPWPLSPR